MNETRCEQSNVKRNLGIISEEQDNLKSKFERDLNILRKKHNSSSNDVILLKKSQKQFTTEVQIVKKRQENVSKSVTNIGNKLQIGLTSMEHFQKKLTNEVKENLDAVRTQQRSLSCHMQKELTSMKKLQGCSKETDVEGMIIL